MSLLHTQEKLLGATGILTAICLILGLWTFAGFFPPPSPLESPEFYAAHYEAHGLGMPMGGIFIAMAGTLYATLFAAYASYIRRMEGGVSGPLTNALVLASAIGGALFFLSGLLFGVAAFRPEQSLDTWQTLNDFAWITLVMPGMPGTIQACSIGLAILTDRSGLQMFPRWFGFFNIWIGVIFFPGMLVILFKTGPFAWDGLFAFWLPAIFFTIWVIALGIAPLYSRSTAPSVTE